eukprot:TRINITY_DN19156_c0_g1_i1.p1 TRINITY_DN19156_c0_g1~~TRINITY_DN19156_c0_g1_i1.p1  ORF type:complete len:152 (+),score=10.94 TRINITY_DN19156_c0_g1_i1:50-505(+)
MAEEGQIVSCSMKMKIFTSGLGVILGCIAFFVFTFQFGNYHAGLWALLSCALASIVLHQHLLYRNLQLQEWHTEHSLAALRNLGILTGLASSVASIYYVYTAVSEHQPTYPIRDSYLLGGVWAFMTFKWSVGTIYYSHKYKTILAREYSLF